jgi:hypothetical protein
VDIDPLYGLKVGLVLAIRSIFVFHLNGNDGTAIGPQKRLELLPQVVHICLGCAHKFRIEAANLDGWIFQQPVGVTAEAPFSANIWAGTQNHIQADLLRVADELRNVILSGKIPLAGVRLMHVPECIHGDGVEPHGFRLQQSIAPVRPRNARIVHLARDNLDRFAIQYKMAVIDRNRIRHFLHIAGLCRLDDQEHHRKEGGK